MSNDTDKTMAEHQGLPTDQAGAPEELIPSDWTSEQVESWKEQAAKAQEHWERLVRVSADLDNYKKRAARERQEAMRFANASLFEKLIPVLDNLEMALTAANNAQETSGESLKTGVSMVYNQLRNALTEAGLEEIESLGKTFDPNWHEAVAQEASAEVPEGNVLKQLRKGFKLKDRLIRPATVVVARKPVA